MTDSKKILITGGAGFIGSNLVEYFLFKGHSVRVLDNFLTGKPSNIADFYSHPQFELIAGDIRDYSTCERAVKGMEIVLHQAALGSVPRSINDPLTTNEINVSGFLNVLQSTHREGIRRFVYAASSSTYGDSKELPKVEENIGKPLSPYAVTKYVNELYAGVFHQLYGMEIIGLRYFNVFGKNQDPNGAYAAAIPKFIQLMLNQQSPEIYGDGNNSRDFTYIKNVIQANEKAAFTSESNAFGEVFNVAYGERTTLNDLIGNLKSILQHYQPEVAHLSPVYKSERVGEIPHSLASIDKAKRVLGYAPEYNLERGLQEAAEFYVHQWKNTTL